MDINQRERAKVLSGIQRNIKKKKWGCLWDDCQETAINSHLLQRKGMLSEICDGRNMFYEIRETDANTWPNNKQPVSFKLVGISEAISLPIFCNKHDTELFSEIERQEVDFDNYRHQLLLCLRAAYSEVRKKQVVIERYSRLLNSSLYFSPGNTREFKESIRLNRLGIGDLEQDIDVIKSELSSSSNRYCFIHKVFGRHDVYASAISTYDMTIKDVYDPNEKLDSFFFHIIPYKDQLHILLGYDIMDTNQDLVEYIGSWRKCDEEHLGSRLTVPLAFMIENWGMSVSLYNQLNNQCRERFLELFQDSIYGFPLKETIEFNLFEGVF